MQAVLAVTSSCKPLTPGYSEVVGTRRHLFAALIVALVVLAVALAVTPWDAPGPVSSAAPADRFSSERAMDVLRHIAAEPRPIGSRQSAVVREYIFARLQALALMPHVQANEVVSQREPRVAGLVHNVVGRLPGRDPSRAVLLVAHYDSVATAPGAADDGSGVAALLETARALRAGPPPANDIIFLFTDGEERGLLGSQSFLEREPWAYAAGVVLNFDSAGSSSPALMYETSPQNGRLVQAYLAAGRPYGSSLMYEVSRRQPVVSDFRPFVARGIPGMTFGMLDGPAYDHTAYDSLGSFHEAGLQHEGETALALARRLGDADLWSLRGPDLVYFDLTGSVAVSYPTSYVRPFMYVALALFVAAVALAARRRLLTLRGVAWATLGTSATLCASLLVVAIGWSMYRTAYEERVWTGTGVVISDWYRLGLVLLAAAVVLGIYAGLLRRLRAWDLAVVALAWWAAGSVIVALSFPGASYLLTWSLAGGALGLAGAALVDRPGDGRPAAALIALAGAVPGLMLLSSAVYLLLMSAGLKQGVTVLAVWLLAGLLMLPLASRPAGVPVLAAGGARRGRRGGAVRRRVHGGVRQPAPQVHERLLPPGAERQGHLGDHRPPRRLHAHVPRRLIEPADGAAVLPAVRVAGHHQRAGARLRLAQAGHQGPLGRDGRRPPHREAQAAPAGRSRGAQPAGAHRGRHPERERRRARPGRAGHDAL